MRWILWGGGGLVLAGLAWLAFSRSGGDSGKGRRDETYTAPVEVAPVNRGPIELRRIFSGTLESPARFVVAPKVGGLVERLTVDLADPVEKGQVVAQLDDDEYVQAVAQALADLEVARANFAETRSNLEIAQREMARVTSLQERGVATEAQFDSAQAQLLTRQAAVEVAKAQITRTEAALEGARIRLGYTQVTASWTGGGRRVVGERHINEGGTVAANTPLLTIVELDPMIAVVFVTEKDYGLLRKGQPGSIRTDAFPGTPFAGKIERVAPVFNQASRQARVELIVANPEQRLKPGMFVHVEVVLDRALDATTVPASALVTRGGKTGVFLVNADGDAVSWRPVEIGIRHGERAQVLGQDMEGRVVTLGHQLIDDGSPVTIPEP